MTHKLSLTTLKVLDILNDCKVHAGSDMAVTLDISRTAIWKIIQRLRKYHIDIQSQHQGYQLNEPLILLDKKKIQRELANPEISLEIFETLPSTSDYLKSNGSQKNSFCLAEHQSKGRGRLGRTWASPFGRNIYLSFRYAFAKDIGEMPGLSLVTGILTVKVLESLNPKLKPFLKWPNDIYINGQKTGGILIELMAEAHGNCTAIISVGLNVNMKDTHPGSIGQPWTSLENVLNEKVDRNRVSGKLIQSILDGMEVFQQKGMEPFLPEWKSHDLLENKTISLNTGAEIISGISRGINPQGYLLLELAAGNVETFSYGDTAPACGGELSPCMPT